MARPPLARIALLAVLLCAAAARADETNFRPYAIGSRASGMGGAFTALADDGSGPFYNPAGIAFAHKSQISLSGSVYGLVSGTISDALGDGHDFTYRGLNVFPVTTSAIWRSGPAEQGSALAFSVFVPDGLRVDDRDSINSAQNAFFLTQEVQTVWLGGTASRRFGRLSLGASGFFLLGTTLSQLDLTVIDPARASRFATLTSRIDASTYGALASIGARFDATPDVHFGLSLFSPELGFGTRRIFVRVTAGDGATAPGSPSQQQVVRAEDLHASPSLPLRLQAGVAATFGALTLSADGMFLAPREVLDDEDRPQFTRHVVRHAVVNASVGAEYVIDKTYPLRAGFFTDFAASNAPTLQPAGGQSSNADNSTHVDRYGLTASAGMRTEHTATDLGVNLAFGSGTDLVPNNLDFSVLKPTSASQLFLYVFLASAYEF